MVVACYVAIGFADTLHYRPRLQPAGTAGAAPVYSNDAHSVLDLAL